MYSFKTNFSFNKLFALDNISVEFILVHKKDVQSFKCFFYSVLHKVCVNVLEYILYPSLKVRWGVSNYIFNTLNT